MDTTLAILFGKSFDSSSNPVKADEAARFADAFDYAQHKLARRGRLGELYFLLNIPKFRRSCREVHAFIDEIVAEALAEFKDTSKPQCSSQGRYVFLKALLNQTRDPKVLRDQCVNLLLAGRDTTAGLLSWTT